MCTRLVDPAGTGEPDHYRDDHVYETGHDGSDDHAEVAERGGDASGERGEHRGEECERGAEEHGTPEFGQHEVNEGSDAGSEECRRLRHPVSYYRGHRYRGREDRQQLLEREDNDLPRFGSVANVVDKFHLDFPSVIVRRYALSANKNAVSGRTTGTAVAFARDA